MSDMVQRVARELAYADDEDYMEDARRYDHRARAAIAAMRKLTGPMIVALDAAIDGGYRDARTLLGVMIDAALKE